MKTLSTSPTTVGIVPTILHLLVQLVFAVLSCVDVCTAEARLANSLAEGLLEYSWLESGGQLNKTLWSWALAFERI